MTYGLQDFSPLVATGPAPTPAGPAPSPAGTINPRLPPVARLLVVSSSTGLGYQETLSPRLSMGIRAGVNVSGGGDDLARVFLPLQKGASGSASLGWAAGPHDKLSLGIAGEASAFSNGAHTQLVSGAGSWSTQLGPQTQAGLSLGAGASRSDATGGKPSWQPTLSAGASGGQEIQLGDQRMSASGAVTLGSVVDPLTGAPYQNLSARASLAYSPLPALRFAASAGGARALSAAAGDQTLATADAAVGLRLGEHLGLTAGSRGAWQQGAESLGIARGAQWAAYASVSVNDSGRF